MRMTCRIETVYQDKSSARSSRSGAISSSPADHNRFGFIALNREKAIARDAAEVDRPARPGDHRRFHRQAALGGERQGIAIGRAMHFTPT